MPLSVEQLKALDLRRNLLVTAGAGSGKTTVLVNRFLHILLQRPRMEIQNVLAITYTDKAAAEMKERIFQEINQRFSEDPIVSARLFELLQQLNQAQISTIHGFCANILRQYSVEVGINPDFEILDDVQKEDFLQKSFREFFLSYQITYGEKSTYQLSALREFSIKRLKEFLFKIYNARAILAPHFQSFNKANPEDVKRFWLSEFVRYHDAVLSDLFLSREFFNSLQFLCQLPIDQDGKERDLQRKFRTYLEKIENPETDHVEKIVSLIQIIQELTTRSGEAYSRIPGRQKVWGKEGTQIFKELSQVASQYTNAVILIHPEVEEVFFRVYLGLLLIASDFLEYVEERKRHQNTLDFEDLQIQTIRLLKSNWEVREQIRRRFPFVLVDEFQDTDVLQSEIIHLLVHDRSGKLDENRLFVVGDPKQSIYGFRNADVSIFQQFAEKISKQGTDKLPILVEGDDASFEDTLENRRGVITLSQNFRSTPSLIHFFNYTFSSIFQKDSEYDVKFQPLQPGREIIENGNSKIQLDLFVLPDDLDVSQVEAQVRKMAENILKLAGTNFSDHYREEIKKLRAKKITFGDIAVLIRSRSFLGTIEQVFREKNIPYQTYKGKGFFQTQEIQDIYYILRSIVDPDDDFALLVFLRSPYVGLSDVTLFYLNQVQGDTYWEKLQKIHKYFSGHQSIEEIFQSDFSRFIQSKGYQLQIGDGEIRMIQFLVEKIPQWNELALHGHFSLLLDIIIDELQMRALLREQPDSDQKLANLDKFLHYLFELEQNRTVIATEFIEFLKKQITGQIGEGEATILLEKQDKVNILTYHAAKGMEFPVVFLPFLERSFQFDDTFLTHKSSGMAFKLERSFPKEINTPFAYNYLRKENRNKIVAEEKRLFYVAATRAKDHLFMSGFIGKGGKLSDPSYLKWLLNSYRLQPGELQKGQEILLNEKGFEFSVKIHLLKESIQESPLAKSVEYSPKETQVPDFSVDELKLLERAPEKPGGQIYSATQLMLFHENKERYFKHYYLRMGNIQPPPVELEYADEPGGAVWGSIVHQLLENFHRRPADDDVRKIQQIFLNMGVIDPEEKQNLQTKLLLFMDRFRNSEFAEKLSMKEQFSEFRVEMRIEEFIFAGIFDRLYQNTDGHWEVLDFKTNRIKPREIEHVASKYQFQMEAYALLLSGLFPEQKNFPVTLLFLEPMKTFSKTFTLDQIQKIYDNIHRLMHQIFEEEQQFYLKYE